MLALAGPRLCAFCNWSSAVLRSLTFYRDSQKFSRYPIETRVGRGVVWCCFRGGFCEGATWGDGCRGGDVSGSRVDGHLR